MWWKISHCMYCLDLNYICSLERPLFLCVWDRRFKVKILLLVLKHTQANFKSLHHHLFYLHKYQYLVVYLSGISCVSQTGQEIQQEQDLSRVWVRYFYLRWPRLHKWEDLLFILSEQKAMPLSLLGQKWEQGCKTYLVPTWPLLLHWV